MFGSFTCVPYEYLVYDEPAEVSVVVPFGATPATLCRQPSMLPTELIIAWVGWTDE